MRRIFGIIGLFLCTACAPGGSSNVELIVTDQAEVQRVAEEDAGTTLPTKFGYAIWDGEGNCTIWIMRMEDFYNERSYNQTLGHELRHCFEGEFHP